MSKGVFSLNLEFLQYLWDFLYKSFGSVVPKKKYNGLKRRLEILKIQGNKNLKNINKLLPPHLITNKLAFQINKNKDFMDLLNDNNDQTDENNKDNDDDENNINEINSNSNSNDELDQKLDKYNLFFKLLQEDLAKFINRNKFISNEISDAEEEKDYYLEKLQTIFDLCKEEKEKAKTDNKKKICEDIMNIISNIPEDFK